MSSLKEAKEALNQETAGLDGHNLLQPDQQGNKREMMTQPRSGIGFVRSY